MENTEATIDERIQMKENEIQRIKKNLDTESDEKNKARLTDKLTIATSDMEKLKEEKERQIYSTIIITPDINDDNSKYKMMGQFEFNIAIKENDGQETLSIEGKLITNVMLESTKIDALDTWRYTLNKININNIQCNSVNDNILYTFTADSFEVKA